MTTPPYAGFWERAGALVLDAIVMLIPSFISGYAFGLMYSNRFAHSQDEATLLLGVQLWGNIGGLIVGWIYFALMESSKHQGTVGKIVVGLKVVDATSLQRITFAQATGRYFARIISAIPFTIGFLIQPFTKRRQTLHDMMAGCLVLKRDTVSAGQQFAPPPPPGNPPPINANNPSPYFPPPPTPVVPPPPPTSNPAENHTDNPQPLAQPVPLAPVPMTTRQSPDTNAFTLQPTPNQSSDVHSADDIDDAPFYAQAMAECTHTQCECNVGLWAKAFSLSNGNEMATKAKYIELRAYELLQRERERLHMLKIEDEQRREAENAETLRLEKEENIYTCPCGFTGHPEIEPRGDAGTAVVLMILFVLPGIIYSIFYSGYKAVCPKCARTLAKHVEP